jgi:hypothetical protein
MVPAEAAASGASPKTKSPKFGGGPRARGARPFIKIAKAKAPFVTADFTKFATQNFKRCN